MSRKYWVTFRLNPATRLPIDGSPYTVSWLEGLRPVNSEHYRYFGPYPRESQAQKNGAWIAANGPDSLFLAAGR